jgi:hypothetical protein
MLKDSNKLWLGFAAGMAAGALIARNVSRKGRMPNAKNWQRILGVENGPVEAAALMARTQRRYDELVSQSGVFENQALQNHLQKAILPMLALYQSWLADGFDQETALAKVDALYEMEYKTGKKGLFIVGRIFRVLPDVFRIFKRLVRAIIRYGYPAPGFVLTYIPEDEYRFGFDIHRCFYQDVVTHFGAPELTASFCKVDNFTMEVLPRQIQWSRTGTLGTGATHCDYRWEFVPGGVISIAMVSQESNCTKSKG